MRGGEEDLFRLWRRKKSENDLLAVYTCLIGAYREDGDFFFSEVHTGNKRSQVAAREIPAACKEKVFTVSVVKHWQVLIEMLKSL